MEVKDTQAENEQLRRRDELKEEVEWLTSELESQAGSCDDGVQHSNATPVEVIETTPTDNPDEISVTATPGSGSGRC